MEYVDGADAEICAKKPLVTRRLARRSAEPAQQTLA